MEEKERIIEEKIEKRIRIDEERFKHWQKEDVGYGIHRDLDYYR